MLGVDFVINALFDTSGVRPEGDWARVAPKAKSKTLAIAKTRFGFTTLIVIVLVR
jgi:hypothetical protein